MSDLISRQEAIDAVEESRRLNHHQDGKKACAHEYEHRHFLKILKDLPSAQPEREQGRWINNSPVTMKCDQCGYVIKDWRWNESNFCANCGADMRGEQDE